MYIRIFPILDKVFIKGKELVLKQGLNILLGFNGVGKTRIIKEIEKQFNSVPVVIEDLPELSTGEKIERAMDSLLDSQKCIVIDGVLERLDSSRFIRVLEKLTNIKQVVTTLGKPIDICKVKANFINVKLFWDIK